MTRKEQTTVDNLSTIVVNLGSDVSEIKTDVKSLLFWQATFTERCKTYDKDLKALDDGGKARQLQIDWLNRKMYVFGGAIAVIVFIVEKFVKRIGW